MRGARLSACAHLDAAAALGRSLNKAENLLQSLLHAVRIAFDDGQVGIQCQMCVRPARSLAGQAVEIHVDLPKRRLTRFEPVQVEHLADHRVDLLRLAEYVGRVSANLIRRELAVHNQLAQALDTDQCRPRLMADHGGEGGDDALEAFERRQVSQCLHLAAAGHAQRWLS